MERDWNMERERHLERGRLLARERSMERIQHVERERRPKRCINGVSNCPYNFCVRGRPIFAWKKFMACGTPRDDGCNHGHCNDPTRKFADGTFLALHYQAVYNRTGKNTQVPHIGFTVQRGIIKIFKELTITKFEPQILGVDWRTSKIQLHMVETGITYRKSPITEIEIPDRKLPGIVDTTKLLWITIFNAMTSLWGRPPFRGTNLTIGHIMGALIIAMMINSASASAQDKLTDNFLYEKKATAIMNPNYLYIGKRYLMCDIIKARESLDKLLTAHSKICDTTFHRESHPLTQDVTEDFYLFKGRYNSEEAQILCAEIDSSPVEIRSMQSAMALNAFMGSHNIQLSWAGIRYERLLHEPVFMSDGKLAAGQKAVSQTVDLFTKHNTSVTVTWDEAIPHRWEHYTYAYEWGANQHVRVRQFFQGNKVELYASTRSNVPLGVVRKLPVVCNTPKTFVNNEPIGWRNNCKLRHQMLKERHAIAMNQMEQILPENIPKAPKPFVPFIQYPQVNDQETEVTANVSRAMTVNLLTDANTLWGNILKNDEKPLGSQCIEYQDILLTRERRWPVMKIVKTVFSAASFFTQIFPVLSSLVRPPIQKMIDEHYSTTVPPPKTKSGVLTPADIIPVLSDIQNHADHVSVLFQSQQNASFTLSVEQQIQHDFRNVIDYISDVHGKFIRLVYDQQFRPSNSLDFITQEEFHNILNYVKRKYGVNLNNDMSLLNTFTASTQASYWISTGIALEEFNTKADVFNIHKMPTISNTTKYTPISTIEHIAIMHDTRSYIPLTSFEAMTCIKDRICASMSPVFSLDMAPCEAGGFFENYNPHCEFTASSDLAPTFYVLENRTFYSTGEPITIEIQCINPAMQLPGSDTSMRIINKGEFQIPPTCLAKFNSTTIRPATRALEVMQFKTKPIIRLTAKPFKEIREFLDNIKTTFKPTLMPMTLWKRYVLPLIIALVGIIGGLLVTAIIAWALCHNKCMRICCLSTCTRYRAYEINAVENCRQESKLMSELQELRHSPDPEALWPEAPKSEKREDKSVTSTTNEPIYDFPPPPSSVVSSKM